MSNILPSTARSAVWSAYRARFILAGSLIGISTAALCALALLPSYLVIHSGNDDPSAQGLQDGDQADRAAIVRTQLLLTTLSPLISATTSPSGTISAALASRVPNITIDRISYTAGDSGTLILSGIAKQREAVSVFRQALSGDKRWKGVTVPVGELAGVPGGRFSITLTGDF